ncbi:MAG: hypothetical protein AVDCRST_MAG30-1153, partial [uncultured Solirubrobacteraceae bacterium]
CEPGTSEASTSSRTSPRSSSPTRGRVARSPFTCRPARRSRSTRCTSAPTSWSSTAPSSCSTPTANRRRPGPAPSPFSSRTSATRSARPRTRGCCSCSHRGRGRVTRARAT